MVFIPQPQKTSLQHKPWYKCSNSSMFLLGCFGSFLLILHCLFSQSTRDALVRHKSQFGEQLGKENYVGFIIDGQVSVHIHEFMRAICGAFPALLCVPGHIDILNRKTSCKVGLCTVM